MRIFTKKSFAFRVEGGEFITRPLEFADAPEDIRGDPMFEMASAAGELEVIGDSKRAKRSNKPEKDPPEGGESRASGDAPPEV